MKPERAFVAERQLAQHCPELLQSKDAAPVQLMPALSRLGDGAARTLSNALAQLTAGEPPLVRSKAPRECTMAELSRDIAPLAANSLLTAGAPDMPVLASLDAEAVLRMVDRAFGGRGEAPSPLPSAFPLSAELMVSRLEGVVVTALGQALGMTVSPLRRDGCIVQLAPFADDEQVGVITLEVDDPGRSPWKVTVAFPQSVMIKLLGDGEPKAPKPARSGRIDPMGETFGPVPLTISAVLVDMRIGFAELSKLQPGQILPVAVARSVPLKVGDKTIAHGTIGALDDRVAVQITQAF
ncbi:FliM/FliN family flagellar motor switch protein [Novosphingobium sp. G106]|uniref:FliM/FliN family flagellar motor switch protein n=1 Tax=Novosphingobium sp. G106 TaxID=2849500 RepID=UPI001C2D1776|nr:FliM/FliN family flagellar motor switch protein [Novosphingobium sp. G106]MBV1690681.1 FliM/FliN family flagellar motor switch protein [Novosphingobium sp. G106]